ncbi:MAG: metallophosphoesterase [Thermoproteota archaeon]|nr:MAG: metallophosphoesterase [Candidatus Korarchaeota archaeon]
MPTLVATSDVHSPKYLGLLREAVAAYRGEPDLVILAGDLVNKGRVEEIDRVLEEVEKLGAPIVAVFGNEEYDSVKEELVDRCGGRVTWLDDSAVEVRLGGETVSIVGSRGSLLRPTTWQARHVPGIERVYAERIERIDELLSSRRARYTVLVTHYAPTFSTLVGEDRRIWSRLGHPRLEAVIRRRAPDVVIHGHAHNGRRKASVGGVPVYNVALPLWRSLVEVRLEPRGLEALL